MSNVFLAGAGRADYTPSADQFPIKLFFSPGNPNPFQGVHDHTYARAVMLSDGTNKAVIISVEMPAPPDTDKWMYYEVTPTVSRVAKALQIPEENVFVVGTHSHAVPGVGDVPPQASQEAKDFDQVYSTAVYQAILDAVREAESSLRPARIGVGRGSSYINTNRYRYYTPTDGSAPYLAEGVNPEGPSDKTVFCLRIEDTEGVPIAFYVNYAVHGVVMMGNALAEGNTAISADIAGYVSTHLEADYPGCVAIWSPAPCGDQNPLYKTVDIVTNPETGRPMPVQMKDSENILTLVGSRHYEDVKRTIEQITCPDRNTDIRCAVDWSVTPGRTPVFNEEGKPWSGVKEYLTEGAPDVRIRLQLLRIGDIALIGASGELYTRLGWAIRSASPLTDTCVAELCGSRIPGYVQDDEAINAGMMSGIQPGYVPESLARVTRKLFEQSSVLDFQ